MPKTTEFDTINWWSCYANLDGHIEMCLSYEMIMLNHSLRWMHSMERLSKDGYIIQTSCVRLMQHLVNLGDFREKWSSGRKKKMEWLCKKVAKNEHFLWNAWKKDENVIWNNCTKVISMCHVYWFYGHIPGKIATYGMNTS